MLISALGVPTSAEVQMIGPENLCGTHLRSDSFPAKAVHVLDSVKNNTALVFLNVCCARTTRHANVVAFLTTGAGEASASDMENSPASLLMGEGTLTSSVNCKEHRKGFCFLCERKLVKGCM